MPHLATASNIAVGLVPTPSVPDTTITPGPRINFELVKKQDANDYVGWRFSAGEWHRRVCASGATFYSTGNNWGCCNTSANGCATLAISCFNGNLIFPQQTSGTITDTTTVLPCSSVYTSDLAEDTCNTSFLFWNEGDSSALYTQVRCASTATNWSYYRNQPAGAVTASEDFSSVSPSVSPSNTPDTSPSVPSSTSSPSLTPNPGADEGSSSKAWIAGAVVGPILGLALIGLLAWFLLRRRKRSQHNKNVAQFPPQQNYSGAPPSGQQYYDPPHNSAMPGMAGFSQQSATTQQQQPWSAHQSMQYGQATGYVSSSPDIGYAQPTQHDAGIHKHIDGNQRAFSSELPGSNVEPNMLDGQVAK